MIITKNIDIFGALLSKEYDPILISILFDLHSIVDDMMVTEGWREGGGVHSTEPCRGLDLRSWIYTSAKLVEIETYINARWQYDPKRLRMKCCIIHDSGRGVHIHLQCHPNTVRIQWKNK